ncbi:MAG: hypothetical protein ACKV0T_00685 [Planctomycetales bacterium]
MADFLSLEWDQDQICGVQAQIVAGRVRIGRCFAIPRPHGSVASSGPLDIGFLQTQLSSLGVTSGDALVVLPRDEAVVRRAELPEASDDELPVLVRFQAGAKSSVPLDELSLDFIPLPRRNEIPGREVLMATVPQQTITEIRTLCETAGLKLIGLGLAPAAIAELVARAEAQGGTGSSGASLVVSRHGSRLEISVLRQGHLLFSHAARLSVEATGPDPQAIVSEVSRALVALRGSVTDVKIERVWTLLDDASHGQLSEVLQRRLSCEVRPLDLFATVDWDRGKVEPGLDKSAFSGPIGMLLGRADPRVPGIDFLSPRRPPVKRDTQKRRRVILGTGVAVLVALLAGNFWLKLHTLQSSIDALTIIDNELSKSLKEGEPTLMAMGLIDEWDGNGTAWLDQLAVFTETMPSTERIYLKSLELNPRNGRLEPRIKADGYAREREDAMNLNETFLAAHDHYRVKPPTVGAYKDDPYYPRSFNTEIVIKDPEKKKTKGAATPAAKMPATATSAPKAPEKQPADENPAQSEAESAPAKAPVSAKTGGATKPNPEEPTPSVPPASSDDSKAER